MDLRLLAVCALLMSLMAESAEIKRYSTKFDYLNMNQILRNNRLVKSYYNCLMDSGPCTQEGFEFRRTFPDALRTKCKKCNPMQKKNAKIVIEYVMKNKPDLWQGVAKRFDPTGKLTKNILTDPKFQALRVA